MGKSGLVFNIYMFELLMGYRIPIISCSCPTAKELFVHFPVLLGGFGVRLIIVQRITMVVGVMSIFVTLLACFNHHR